MSSAPDHPIIRALMTTGYPDGKDPVYPRCPICSAECEDIYYRNRDLRILGCDNCVKSADAWQEEECFPSEDDFMN